MSESGRYTDVTGRYIQLRLTLVHTSNASPRIGALRAWFPRFSYLDRYLPAVWRSADPDSATFTERYLANIEGLFTGLEDWIVAATTLFDPRVAPADALPWLATWYGVTLDPAWTVAQRRFFLRHAVRLFNQRGTVAGLCAAVRLALDPAPTEAIFEPDERLVRIRERFGDRRHHLSAAEAKGKGLWHPAAGRGDLLARWARAGGTGPLDLTPPTGDARETWRRFWMLHLGFVPAATSSDAPAWRRHLRHRHRDAAALSSAWGETMADLDQVTLPLQLPASAAALSDWYRFESLVLPMAQVAHRFTVSVLDPVDAERRLAQRALIERVVSAARPAHSGFEVRFHPGATAPDPTPFELDQSALGGEDRLVQRGADTWPSEPQTLGHVALGEGHLVALPELPARPTPPTAERET